ncbi:DUF2490 domain-containing protein, partial [bacterium]|nr:DUF2490 domain-containing protein [bacterium]
MRDGLHNLSTLTFLVLGMLFGSIARTQSVKEINDQTQFWWSVNSTTRFTDKWGLVGDFHIRRNDFVNDPSFNFIRFGSHFWLTEKFALTLGYAHMWQAPANEDGQTWTDENRIYQQLQYISKIKNVSVLNRFRNEQRWKEEVVDDVLTGRNLFSNRIRYLLSFTIPVSKNPAFPQLVLSDEILM